MLYRVVLTFESMDEVKLLSCTNSCSAVYYMLYKVVLTFESVVHKILKCDHSNESYRAVLSCGGVVLH